MKLRFLYMPAAPVHTHIRGARSHLYTAALHNWCRNHPCCDASAIVHSPKQSAHKSLTLPPPSSTAAAAPAQTPKTPCRKATSCKQQRLPQGMPLAGNLAAQRPCPHTHRSQTQGSHQPPQVERPNKQGKLLYSSSLSLPSLASETSSDDSAFSFLGSV